MYSKRTWWPVMSLALLALGSILIAIASARAQAPPNFPPTNASVTDSVGGAFSWASQQTAIAPAAYGPALLDGEPGGSLQSSTFSGITLVSGSMVGTGSPSSLSAMNVNRVFNVQSYGAAGNGRTNDAPASQAAIDAGCAANSTTPVTVSFPPALNYYSIGAPLFIHCSGIHIVGPSRGVAGQDTIRETAAGAGPVFVPISYSVSGIMTGAPIISGSTASMATNGAIHYWVNLADAPSFSVNGDSRFTLDGYVEFTTVPVNAVAIAGSSGQRVVAENPTIAYQIATTSTPQFQWNLTVNGTKYTLTDTTTTIAATTLYHLALTYDGTTIRAFTNGTEVASSAHSGTITQPYWEVPMLAAQGGGGYPDNQNGTSPINGEMDGWRISNSARWTTNFTPCNCFPTFDSNTVVIANPSQNLHMLTQLEYSNNGAKATLWSYVRRISEDNGTNDINYTQNGIEIDDLSVFGITGMAAGYLINSTFRRVGFDNANFGIDLFENDYENTFDQVEVHQGNYPGAGGGVGGYLGIFNGGQSGLNYYNSPVIDGFITGYRQSDSSVVMINGKNEPEVNTIQPFGVSGIGGNSDFVCTGCGADIESAAAAVDTYLLDSVTSSTIENYGATGTGASPAIEVSGSGTTTLIGMPIGAQASSGRWPTAMIHVTDPNAANGGRFTSIVVQNSSNLNPQVPWTDNPSVVQITPCRGSITLVSGAGVFSNNCLLSSAVCNARDTTASNSCTAATVTDGRQFTDGATHSNRSLTSPADASFVSTDVGRAVYGPGIPPNTFITAVGSGTNVTISNAATATASGLTIYLAGSSVLTGTGSDVCVVGCP